MSRVFLSSNTQYNRFKKSNMYLKFFAANLDNLKDHNIVSLRVTLGKLWFWDNVTDKIFVLQAFAIWIHSTRLKVFNKRVIMLNTQAKMF